ncbi:MAG: TetR/AcrR family transcriptional regulator, partial [bacterium]
MSTVISQKSRGPRWQQVLDVAIACFHDKGYEGTSLQELADQVGMQKGSIYHYIHSKEDLLYEVINKAHQVAIELIDETTSHTDLEPLQKIEILVRSMITRSIEMYPLASIFYTDVRHLHLDRRREIYKTRVIFEQMYCDLIEHAQVAGQIRTNAPAMLLTQVSLASINSLQAWYNPSHSIFEPMITADTCV